MSEKFLQTGHYSEEIHRATWNMVGSKWSVLTLLMLEGGTKRFSDLQRGIEGISGRMLARSLRELQRHGFLARRVEAMKPPRTYYSLTPLGKAFLGPVKVLVAWASSNYRRIEEAQISFAAQGEPCAGSSSEHYADLSVTGGSTGSRAIARSLKWTPAA